MWSKNYIVKEHYDWLKSSAVVLSTLKKHVIFFRTRYWDVVDYRGYGGESQMMPAQHHDVYQPSAMDDRIIYRPSPHDGEGWAHAELEESVGGC